MKNKPIVFRWVNVDEYCDARVRDSFMDAAMASVIDQLRWDEAFINRLAFDYCEGDSLIAKSIDVSMNATFERAVAYLEAIEKEIEEEIKAL